MNESHADAPRHVAVIAVHGVADQKPRETARTIADVLSRVGDADGRSLYGAFEEVDVRVPVRSATAGPARRQTTPTRDSLFAMKQGQVIRDAVTAAGAEPTDHKYMR